MFGKSFRRIAVVVFAVMLLISITANAQETEEKEIKTDIGVAVTAELMPDDYVVYHILPYKSIVMSDHYYNIRESLEKNKLLASVNTIVVREKGEQNSIEHYLVIANSEVNEPVYERIQVIINDSLDWVEEDIQNYTAEGYTFVDIRKEGEETILIFEKN